MPDFPTKNTVQLYIIRWAVLPGLALINHFIQPNYPCLVLSTLVKAPPDSYQLFGLFYCSPVNATPSGLDRPNMFEHKKSFSNTFFRP